jgi:hypothetical protein
MSTKKTIQINPELFKIAGKTKKIRDKKELAITPIINPNNLKNKLLNRIKEHKQNEIKNKKNQINENKLTGGNTNSDSINNDSSDEFYNAMGYLSDLKKQKINQMKQKSLLNNRTVKNIYNNNNRGINNIVTNNSGINNIVSNNSGINNIISNNSVSNSNGYNNLNISLDLPPELKEPIKPTGGDIYKVNYKTDDEVPYGCLKGGHKKTYREWKELTNPVKDVPDIIRPPTPPKKNNVGVFLDEETSSKSREERLEHIKNKLKKMQDAETVAKQESLEKFKKLEQQLTRPSLEDELFNEPVLDLYNDHTDIDKLIQERNKKETDKPKKYMKKTTRQKYTLGKSKNLRRVSVLIKNRQTRKNIIDTQKELKKTDITDVRKYLRQHGMIKVGSTCPPDILRKTFETAILTGEVNNTNKETLLHNFLSGADKEK